jgi:NAD(P)-dependent dehydrogenase (short-subunit alcohol dehydrogenase family)
MRAVIIGSSGGIGSALVTQMVKRPDTEVHALSRGTDGSCHPKAIAGSIDIEDETSIEESASAVLQYGRPDLVLVATGVLSDDEALTPEKSLRQQSAGNFERSFRINTIGPALVAKHFFPIMPRSGRAVFAALSARVGSIADNRLGGWHSYRASKAALNMLIKNYAIEQRRKNDEFICVALHPGTVDTSLSRPFQANVPDGKLFAPSQSAEHLLDVVKDLQSQDSGKIFDWAGQEIQP